MPNTQSPYTALIGSTAGSVYTFDVGGLDVAGVALLSGTVGALTLETTAYPGAAASTYGSINVVQNGVPVGTAQTVTLAALNTPYRFRFPVGPVFDLRATVAGSVQTAGTLVVYLRG